MAASSTADDNPPNTAPLAGAHASGGVAVAALAPSFTPSFTPSPAPAYVPQMQPTPAPMPLAISDPFAVPPAPAAATASMLPPVGYSPSQPSMASIAPVAPKRSVPLWFWPILLFTGVFGALAAVFVFKQQQQQPPVVIQMPPPAAAPPATEPKTADVPPPTTSGEAPPVTPTATTTGKVATNSGGSKPAAPVPEKKGLDLGGLVPGAGGPNVGGGSGPGPGAGGGGLDGASIERVVASHRSGVKRTCWERGGADQKSSVNVMVSATVAPDGSVAGTSSSGDDPVVAKCIESQVRGWRFNAPGATTTVNIPFKFVRQ